MSMAASSRNAALDIVAAIFLWALLTCGAAAAPHDSQAPIDLQAASTDFDYRNNTLVFRRVKITQGELQVEAQEAKASGLEFVNSQWTLQGDVRITMPDGKLASQTATVSFRDNQIVHAEIHGTPAVFEQRLEDSRQLAQAAPSPSSTTCATAPCSSRARRGSATGRTRSAQHPDLRHRSPTRRREPGRERPGRGAYHDQPERTPGQEDTGAAWRDPPP